MQMTDMNGDAIPFDRPVWYQVGTKFQTYFIVYESNYNIHEKIISFPGGDGHDMNDAWAKDVWNESTDSKISRIFTDEEMLVYNIK